jgi:outer membrane biogenesis lipoprotein LolB
LYKVELLALVVLLISAGCGTVKNSSTFPDKGQRNAKEVLLNTSGKNITGAGFFIRKGKILTDNESGRTSLYFTMKYNAEGKYLISIRSKTGMEAFRVFLSKDTILINDRLNRKVLYGNGKDFEKITGIPAALLKISIGDFFYNKPVISGGDYCVNNEVKLSDYFQGLIVNSTIDCRTEKLKSIVVSTGSPDKYITIDYRKYREDNYSVPRRVEVNDPARRIKIVITIDKYVAPWVGEIEFIPGSGYKSKPII